jgi:RNA polymerase sigma-32 factor
VIPKPEQDALVEAHQEAANRFAWKTARVTGLHDRIDDIRSEALMGLVIAAQRFDPSRGVQFITFAAYWMRCLVNRYIEANKHVVRPSYEEKQRTIAYKLRATEWAMTQRLGREPTTDELAEELGCRVALLQRVQGRFRRFDVSVAHTEHEPDHYMPRCSEPSPEDHAEEASSQRERMRAINRAMHKLEAREREIIRRRHLAEEPETLADIARTWGCSRERVRQLEQRALRMMRCALLSDAKRLMEVA